MQGQDEGTFPGEVPKDTSRLLTSEREELLFFRVMGRSFKYFMAIVAAVGGILGYFGYDAVKDVRAVKEELQLEAAQLREVISEQRTLLEELEAEIGERTRSLDSYQTAFNDIQRQFWTRYAAMEVSLERSDQAHGDLVAGMSELAETRGNVAASLGRFQTELSSLRSEVQQLHGRVDDVHEKVFRSGSFVVKEKSDSRIYGMDLNVKLHTIHGNTLRKFCVYRVGDVAPLWGPEDLCMGRVITIDDAGTTYEIVPRYVLEHWPGKDVAGLDIHATSSAEDSGL